MPGRVGVDAMVNVANSFTGVKIFSTTLAREREVLGDTVTKWIRENPKAEIVDREVTQSSDKEFHCLTIALFYRLNA